MLNYPITISLDTNIFDSVKYDMSDGSKLQVLLKHVKDGKVKIVLSDIVLEEARTHLKRNAASLCSVIRKNRTELLNIASENIINTIGLEKYIVIPDKDTTIENANKQFENYIQDLGAEILDVSSVNISEIVDDYFHIRAPFENGEKKRKEFPDAFIINQIKQRFPNGDSVIIISNDKGFLKGCHRYNNYKTMNSLDELFKIISEHDMRYTRVIEILRSLEDEINRTIHDYILRTERISVAGLSCDNEGVVYGHDYSETTLRSISNVSHVLHVIDDIDEDNALITLSCRANIDMDCFYEDYDNSVWDSEEKKYIFLRTVHLLEKHCPNFACRIRVDLRDKEIELLPLYIYLGGNSRKSIDIIDSVDDC